MTEPEPTPAPTPARPGGYTVRRAGPADRRVLGMLLGPPLLRRGPAPRAWLALAGGAPEIAGAAALWPRARSGALWLRVVRTRRRAGIGSALLAAVERQARDLGLRNLVTRRPVPVAEGGQFLSALGFEPAVRYTTFETSLASIADSFAACHHRLAHRAAVPADAVVHSVGQIEQPDMLRQAVELVGAHFSARPRALLRRLAGETARPFDRDASVVLVHGGRVVGVGLARRGEAAWVADAVVVHPALRGRWASVVLRHAWAQRALAARWSDRCRFVVREDFADTARFARRLAARAVLRRAIYRRVLD